jgi:hypothetical protein
MREIRLYGSEGGGAARSPSSYQLAPEHWIPAFAGMTHQRGRSELGWTRRLPRQRLLFRRGVLRKVIEAVGAKTILVLSAKARASLVAQRD